MALNIKNPTVERLATEVALLTGESKTEAIRRSLTERHERLLRAGNVTSRSRRGLRYLEQEVWPLVPRDQLGRRLTSAEEDAILGFGPDGT